MLEQKIDELIAVIKELTAAVSAGCTAPKKTKKTAKKEDVKPEAGAPGKEDTKPEPAAESGVTIDDLKEAVKNLCAQDGGRDLTIACLAEFDAEKVSEVSPENYEKVVEVLKKGLTNE